MWVSRRSELVKFKSLFFKIWGKMQNTLNKYFLKRKFIVECYLHSVVFFSLCSIILFSHFSFYPSCICSISSCSVSFTWGIKLQMSIKGSRPVTESTALCFNRSDCFRESQGWPLAPLSASHGAKHNKTQTQLWPSQLIGVGLNMALMSKKVVDVRQEGVWHDCMPQHLWKWKHILICTVCGRGS